MLFDRLGTGYGAGPFVGAADHALLIAVGLLLAAAGAVCWLPRHARGGH